MSFKPIENRSLHIQVFNSIKDRIVSGNLAQTDRLPPENQLCEEFKVSRNIIREAIKSLQSIGLLDVSPGKKGTTVSIPDVRLAQELIYIHLKMKGTSVQELFEARITLESAIARLAAINRTEEDLTALRACLEAMKKCRSLDLATELDFQFHDLIVEASRNSVFKVYNMPLLALQRDLRKQTLKLNGLETANRYHEMLLESLASGDADLAEKTMREHIRSALEVLQQSPPAPDPASV
jgi:GntR family transcriptional regulator, transcriptional repressor for pyruvate dehydrogenase complex